MTNEDSDFRRGAAPSRTVHAWNGSQTACGKPGAGMITGGADWHGIVTDRCHTCAERTS